MAKKEKSASEKTLKINGSFEDAVKAIFKPVQKPKTETEDKKN